MLLVLAVAAQPVLRRLDGLIDEFGDLAGRKQRIPGRFGVPDRSDPPSYPKPAATPNRIVARSPG